MRLLELHVKGFRSLEDLSLGGPELPLGAFNVFYGPNGSGKSNVLAAVGLVGRVCAGLATAFRHRAQVPPDALMDRLVRPDLGLDKDDFRSGAMPRVEFQFRVETDGAVARAYGVRELRMKVQQQQGFQTEAVRLSISGRGLRSPWELPVREWARSNGPAPIGGIAQDRAGTLVWMSGGDAADSLGPEPLGEPEALHFLAALFAELASGFVQVPAVRGPVRPSSGLPPFPAAAATPPNVSGLLAEGQLAEALFRAHTSPDKMMRVKMDKFRRQLEGAPLFRPPFATTQHADGRFELREDLAGGADVPLDLAGLGIYQLYVVLAQVLLAGSDVVCIEEPEAHLHAPTTGRQLRDLLQRAEREGHVKQYFIATHSNLFDLDSQGYFDVRLEGAPGAVQRTVVERKPLVEIDRAHLYEPGPAKHALAAMLERLGTDKVVFRKPAGEPVTASQMLEMLQRDDPLAVLYLRDLHGAVVSLLRSRADREPAA